MNQKYQVKLTENERKQLDQLLIDGTAQARIVRRAQILLKSDCSECGPAWSYKAICATFNVSTLMIARVRRSYVQGGIGATLIRKRPERDYERRLNSAGEAHLISLVNSQPPHGHKRWTLRLLQKQMTDLGYVESISHGTIRALLKKFKVTLT